MAEEITTEVINNAREQLENEYLTKNQELKSHSDDSDSRDEHVQLNRFIGGVSINVNDQNIFDTYNDGSDELDSGMFSPFWFEYFISFLDDDKGNSRPSSSTSRQSSIRSSRSRGSSSRGSSSRRSRNGIDDQTIRQMFRRYLCSPTKDSDLIKQQLHIIQRELNIILDDDENFSDDDEFDSATGKINELEHTNIY